MLLKFLQTHKFKIINIYQHKHTVSAEKRIT
jgi:hypothetical protein